MTKRNSSPQTGVVTNPKTQRLSNEIGSDLITWQVVRGLALMEHGHDRGDGYIESYAAELINTWPVQELHHSEPKIGRDLAREIVVAVLQAHRENVLSGDDDPNALIEAVQNTFARVSDQEDENIDAAVLAGRMFVAGYAAAQADAGIEQETERNAVAQ